MQDLLSSSPSHGSQSGKVMIVTDNAKVKSQAQQHFRTRSNPDVLKGVQRWSEHSEPVAEAEAEPVPVSPLSHPSRKHVLDISDHTKKESRWESTTNRVDLDQPRNPSRKNALPYKVERNAPPVDRLPHGGGKGNDYTMQRNSLASADILRAHLEAASPEMMEGRLSHPYQTVEQVQRALDICNS